MLSTASTPASPWAGLTPSAIGTVIGLSAKQFTRAVLLAHGDFEAFIRVYANDRAALLEQLTGSQVYTPLGCAAYEKARVMRVRLSVLPQRIAAQHGLDDESRAEAKLPRPQREPITTRHRPHWKHCSAGPSVSSTAATSLPK
ncbi:hypothetical protein [Novosphingobium sp. 9U]|uniref:hypothetical protein n=1 Tax=Novosphingobium sp. 9U TaxID=2653158 RepID=UPI0012F1E759|nr:hypothetical protein [Novosphingobium sp. 9U]VWX55201.1 Exonuclease SbcC [Novosphingobium sp. 9U]